MPDGLVDIGQGIKVLNPDTFKTDVKSGVEVATEYLGLMNLQNQVKDYPIDRLKKEADLTLAQNKVDMIGVENDKLRAELESAVQGEIRSKMKFWGDTMVQSLELGRIDPVLGFAQMSKILPKGTYPAPVEGKSGAYNIMVPDNKGGFKSFLFDPSKITDPKQRLDAETQFRKDFESTPEVQRLSILHGALKTAESSLTEPNQGKDLALKYSVVKALDPTSNVMSGEMASIENTTGISQYTLNQINKLMGGAALGEEKSKVRQELFNIVKEKYDTLEPTVQAIGENNYRIAEGSGLKGDSTVRPVGSLGVNDFLPIDKLAELPIKSLTPNQKLKLYKYYTNPGGQ